MGFSKVEFQKSYTPSLAQKTLKEGMRSVELRVCSVFSDTIVFLFVKWHSFQGSVVKGTKQVSDRHLHE